MPEHIGSVTWLLNNQNIVPNIRFTLSANMTAHDAPLAMCWQVWTQFDGFGISASIGAIRRTTFERGFQEYPDCGDEICFDTVGLRFPRQQYRTGEMFQEYHSSR